MSDLASSPEYADKIKDLTALLEQMRKEYGDKAPLNVANPQPAEWSPHSAKSKSKKENNSE